MKALIVLNGEYYTGESSDKSKLVFEPERSKAAPVDERRLKYIISTIAGWVEDDEIQLKRLEILREKRRGKPDVQMSKMHRTN